MFRSLLFFEGGNVFLVFSLHNKYAIMPVMVKAMKNEIAYKHSISNINFANIIFFFISAMLLLINFLLFSKLLSYVIHYPPEKGGKCLVGYVPCTSLPSACLLRKWLPLRDLWLVPICSQCVSRQCRRADPRASP